MGISIKFHNHKKALQRERKKNHLKYLEVFKHGFLNCMNNLINNGECLFHSSFCTLTTE